MRNNKFFGYGAPTIAEQIKGFGGPVEDAMKRDPSLTGWFMAFKTSSGDPVMATEAELNAARAAENYTGLFFSDPDFNLVSQPVTTAAFDLVTGGVYAPANGGKGLLATMNPWVLGLLAIGAFWFLTRKR